MSAALRSVAFRYTIGPAPIPLQHTREAILLEMVRSARLGRRMPTPLELSRVVDRARVTVRWHLRALAARGLVEADADGAAAGRWRPTAKAMEAYHDPNARKESPCS